MIQMTTIHINDAPERLATNTTDDHLEWTQVLKNRLRQARERKGISQPKAAQLIGVDANTLWRWENGYVKKIPIFGLRHLAQEYGVSIGWLVGQEEGLSPDESELLRMYRTARPEFRRAVTAALREGTSSDS